MAYMSQEHKKELAPGIKAVLKRHGFKGSISVRHHSTLVVTVTEGPLDLPADHQPGALDRIDVNTHWLEEHWGHEPKWFNFLTELHAAMSVGNFDKSDIMTDYFHVGWYSDLNLGKFQKPYQSTARNPSSLAALI